MLQSQHLSSVLIFKLKNNEDGAKIHVFSLTDPNVSGFFGVFLEILLTCLLSACLVSIFCVYDVFALIFADLHFIMVLNDSLLMSKLTIPNQNIMHLSFDRQQTIFL